MEQNGEYRNGYLTLCSTKQERISKGGGSFQQAMFGKLGRHIQKNETGTFI